MANIFPPPKKGVVLGEKYDIKGSAGEGPPLCAGPILYRRSLPPPPGTLSRCKFCGQKFYTRKNNQDESDFGVSVVYWPEQLKRLRKPDIVEYNFSKARRLRLLIERSKNRRPSSIRRGVLRTSASERHFYSSSSNSSIMSDKKKLRRSSSSSEIKKIDAILENSTRTYIFFYFVVALTRKHHNNNNNTGTRTTNHLPALRRVGSEFIRRIPSQDIERYLPQPIAPMDWKQCTMVGQTTADGEKEILVDQSSGFRFALSPEVKVSARVIWVNNKLSSPIIESKSEASSPLMSTLSSFSTWCSSAKRENLTFIVHLLITLTRIAYMSQNNLLT